MVYLPPVAEKSYNLEALYSTMINSAITVLDSSYVASLPIPIARFVHYLLMCFPDFSFVGFCCMFLIAKKKIALSSLLA